MPYILFRMFTSPLHHHVSLPARWSGLSSYLLPADNDIEGIFSDVLNELVIVQNVTGYYYSTSGVNTIINWESQSAYQIKLTEAVTLTITGQPETSKTLQLNAGWNLIPVISEVPVAVNELFAAVATGPGHSKSSGRCNHFLARLKYQHHLDVTARPVLFRHNVRSRCNDIPIRNNCKKPLHRKSGDRHERVSLIFGFQG